MTVPVFEVLLTSSLLIAVLIAARYLLRGRVSPRLQYALWALVLVRLLLPVSLSSPLSVMNAAEPAADRVALYLYDAARLSAETGAAPADGSANAPAMAAPPAAPAAGDAQGQPLSHNPGKAWGAPALSSLLLHLWAAGALLVGAWFLLSNLRFSRMLRRRRSSFDAAAYSVPLPVYLVEGLSSPCLFGLLRPAIYLTPACLGDERKLRHILAHELTHHRQKDLLWSALRGLCLSLYWFDPLVWAAALLSRRDCELSCDAGAIRRVGEEERIAYGRTLLGLMAQRTTPGNLLCAATTMSGGERSRRERIALIAKGPRTKAATAVLALLLALLCAACTLTGADRDVQLYTSGGVTLALPKDYAADVLVNPEGVSLPADTLFQVYEKDSFSGQGEGWLFSLCTTDELGYERFQADPHAGIFFLAYGSDAYYYLQFSTSAAGEAEATAEDTLAALPGDYETIQEDFIARNGLAAVSPFLYSALYKGETANLLYAPNGPDDPVRWELFLVQPCTSGEGGIWAVYQWRLYDGSGQGVYSPVFPDGVPSRSYYAQQQLLADQGYQTDLLDPQQAAFAFVEAQGVDANADNVTRFTRNSAAPGGAVNADGGAAWADNVIAEATAQAKELLRQRAGLTDDQLAQVAFAGASSLYVSYNGILDAGIVDGVHQYRTILASQVLLSIPDDVELSAALPTVQTLGAGRTVAVGCVLTTSTAADDAVQDVYLGLIDSGEAAQQSAPSFTDVLNLLLANEAPELLGSAGNAALYSCDALTLAIPEAYAGQVTVETAPAEEPNRLFTVYAASAAAEDGDGDQGFLFSIWQYPLADYSAYLQSDPLDTVFAADNDFFYTVFPGGGADWGDDTLLATILRAFVCADMTERNGLLPVENGSMPWMSSPAP